MCMTSNDEQHRTLSKAAIETGVLTNLDGGRGGVSHRVRCPRLPNPSDALSPPSLRLQRGQISRLRVKSIVERLVRLLPPRGALGGRIRAARLH
jgi:hypothetical protein